MTAAAELILISFSILNSIPHGPLSLSLSQESGRDQRGEETNTNSQKYRRYNIYITHILLFIHHLKKIHAHIDKAYDKC